MLYRAKKNYKELELPHQTMKSKLKADELARGEWVEFSNPTEDMKFYITTREVRDGK
jgi:hypothetical protein